MNTKELFLSNLKELMSVRNVTFVQLGKDIGMNDRTIRRWYEDRAPKVESLIKIANYFHCSLDYLVGMSPIEFDYPPLTDKINFTERYKQLKKDTGLNDAKVAAICKVGTSTVCTWNQGTIPSFEIIVKLCGLFECCYEYIIGRVDNL